MWLIALDLLLAVITGIDLLAMPLFNLKCDIEQKINKWVNSFAENSQRAIEFGLEIYHKHFHDNSKHETMEKLFKEMVNQDHLSDDFQN